MTDLGKVDATMSADALRTHLAELDDPMRLAAQGIFNRDDVWYFKAPLPRVLHRCRPWTAGLGAERCACGAIRVMGLWSEKNSRRRFRIFKERNG